MRTVSALLTLILLVFSVPQAGPAALAQEACRCKGCGCKGSPGWRGPEGSCVSHAKLAEICGSPPGAPCVQEDRKPSLFWSAVGGAARRVGYAIGFGLAPALHRLIVTGRLA